MARRSYSSIEKVTSSGNPAASSIAPAVLPANVSPAQVSTGKPARSAWYAVPHRIVRKCVEEQIRVLMAGQIVGHRLTRGEDEPLRADAPLRRLAPQIVLDDAAGSSQARARYAGWPATNASRH